MRIQGYKLNGYNATYEKTDLDVWVGYNGNKNCVLEVTDSQSGITYSFEINEVLKKRIKTPCKV